ncbi:MAG: DUF1611 domain-containing protein [Solimonas sp.]
MTAPVSRTSAAAPAAKPLALRRPYLLFLADVDVAPHAKTAFGLRDWAPESCIGQNRLPGCQVDLGLAELTPAAAAQAGAGSLVIGVAAAGGRVQPAWVPRLLEAVEAGLDIVSGMHTRLADVPGLADAAQRRGVKLVDVRHAPAGLPTGTGIKRSGKRLLTVGTDCALGKKYTALALARALKARGVDADFRATGQTGILIAGSGLPIDSVVSDFIAGAAETLSPDADAAHWDIVEGQGSLFQPAYAGVTLGLVHGSQPDALVLCHEPGRETVLGLPHYKLPALDVAAARYLEAARLTNPAVQLVGVSLNTAALDDTQRARAIADAERQLGVPAFDPLKTSLTAVIDRMLAA